MLHTIASKDFVTLDKLNTHHLLIACERDTQLQIYPVTYSKTPPNKFKTETITIMNNERIHIEGYKCKKIELTISCRKELLAEDTQIHTTQMIPTNSTECMSDADDILLIDESDIHTLETNINIDCARDKQYKRVGLIKKKAIIEVDINNVYYYNGHAADYPLFESDGWTITSQTSHIEISKNLDISFLNGCETIFSKEHGLMWFIRDIYLLGNEWALYTNGIAILKSNISCTNEPAYKNMPLIIPFLQANTPFNTQDKDACNAVEEGEISSTDGCLIYTSPDEQRYTIYDRPDNNTCSKSMRLNSTHSLNAINDDSLRVLIDLEDDLTTVDTYKPLKSFQSTIARNKTKTKDNTTKEQIHTNNRHILLFLIWLLVLMVVFWNKHNTEGQAEHDKDLIKTYEITPL